MQLCCFLALSCFSHEICNYVTISDWEEAGYAGNGEGERGREAGEDFGTGSSQGAGRSGIPGT